MFNDKERIMKECFMPQKHLIGIGTRTKNENEMGSNGNIPKLWEKFFGEVLPKLKITDKFIYAVTKITKATKTENTLFSSEFLPMKLISSKQFNFRKENSWN